MAAAFFFASDFEEAPQARRDKSSRVGSPLLSRSGPGFPAIRARKDALRGLSPDLTGDFRLAPSVRLKYARPAAFNPPLGFWWAFFTTFLDLLHCSKDISVLTLSL